MSDQPASRSAPTHPTAVPLALAAPLTGPPRAPVLVLGNSLGTSAAVWDRQVGELGESFRLVRYEFPGHGGSATAPGPYTIGGLGAGVLDLLDSLGIGRVGYCGISLGGMVGMWLASHAPGRIAALGLVCTSAYLPPADGWYARAAAVRTAGLRAISAAVISRWFTPAYAAAAPSVIEQFLAGLEDTDPEGYACCCEAIAGMDQRAELAAIMAPTLVIAGADDPSTPPEHGAAIAAGIDGARLDVIPDAAHLAAVSAPDAVTDALRAHLSVTAAGDATWRDER
jgi:3-oxoadipate enol-lactonase